MTVLSVLIKLAGTRSKLEKIQILKDNKDYDDLKNFFRLTLTKSINFFQKKPFEIYEPGNVSMTLAEAFDFLENKIAARVVTGNAARDEIQNVLNSLSEADAAVLRRVLKKDTKCAVGSIVNDVWKKLVPEHPNLLATAYTYDAAQKLNWKAGVQVQRKSDGLRISIEVLESGVTVYSRAGNELDLHGRFDSLRQNEQLIDHVIDAELMVVKEDGKFEDRKTGNGICSRAIKGTLPVEESLKMIAVAWDIIPVENFWGCIKTKTGSVERFDQLSNAIAGKTALIRLIENDIVYDHDSAIKIYDKYRAAGEEGAMLKESDVQWEDRRSKNIFKLKAVETCEMAVVGFKQGEGTFANYIGSLDLASSDGRVEANMSGFSFKIRAEITANFTGNPCHYNLVEDGQEVTYTAMPGDSEIKLGSIVEVKYNEKIKSRDSEVWSLFLPRFDKVRLDKTKANSFEEIK